jgi:hypothetical protein
MKPQTGMKVKGTCSTSLGKLRVLTQCVCGGVEGSYPFEAWKYHLSVYIIS